MKQFIIFFWVFHFVQTGSDRPSRSACPPAQSILLLTHVTVWFTAFMKCYDSTHHGSTICRQVLLNLSVESETIAQQLPNIYNIYIPSELPQSTRTIVFCKTYVNMQYGIAHVLKYFSFNPIETSSRSSSITSVNPITKRLSVCTHMQLLWWLFDCCWFNALYLAKVFVTRLHVNAIWHSIKMCSIKWTILWFKLWH